jgi:hypothetical protein
VEKTKMENGKTWKIGEVGGWEKIEVEDTKNMDKEKLELEKIERAIEVDFITNIG